MPRFAHRILVLIGLALALTAGRAVAQDNFDANKTPAQLFANDCSGCHKSPAGLAKSPGMFGVESFLREHYTASRQAAKAIAGYLRAVDAEQDARTPAKRGKSEPRRKADKKNEPKPEAKTEDKPASEKSEAKPEAKPEPKSEAKSEPKPGPKSEDKPETKPAENKPTDSSAKSEEKKD